MIFAPISAPSPALDALHVAGTHSGLDPRRDAAVDVVVVRRRVDDHHQGRERAGDRLRRLRGQVQRQALRTVYL